jgi:serine/threonine protein phosphatase PrpC
MPATPGSHQRSRKGEDCYGCHKAVIGGDEIELFMIADGHGGKVAAQLCLERVPSYLLSEVGDDASAASLKAACYKAIERVHSDVLATSSTAGTTLTILIVNSGLAEVTVANVGDSAALLIESESETLLTAEHRLSDCTDERERATQAGCRIAQAIDEDGFATGPIRAWPGGLAVCRTIGDADCPAASPVPAVRTIPFNAAAGGAVCICSDGVWDALSPLKVAAFVRYSRTASEGTPWRTELGTAVLARNTLTMLVFDPSWVQPPSVSSPRLCTRAACETTRPPLSRGLAHPHGTRRAAKQRSRASTSASG